MSLVWNEPWLPVIPWTIARVCFPIKTANLCSHLAYSESRCLIHLIHGGQANRLEYSPSLFLVGSDHSYDERFLETHDLLYINYSFRNLIASRNPRQNIDEYGANFLCALYDLKCCCNVFSVCSSTNITEVRGFPAVLFYKVESRHDESCAVSYNADVAV